VGTAYHTVHDIITVILLVDHVSEPGSSSHLGSFSRQGKAEYEYYE
jgi:hypothetical protein